MKKILACLAVLFSAVSLNAAAADIAAGKLAAEKNNCFACHGKDYVTPADALTPKLAGQHQDYLAHALTAYKRGAKGANGRGNPIMGGVVQPLSRKDIQNIAAYLASLPGPLVLGPGQ